MRIHQLATQLFEAMQSDLDFCRCKYPDSGAQVECCYQMADRYWRELKEYLEVYQFTSEQEEIEFFKTVKPQFTSEIEYYNLVYHSLLFRPEPLERHSWKTFWQREQNRLQKFMEETPDFYAYHASGRTDQDADYYLRKNNGDYFAGFRSFETGSKFTTRYDPLVSTLLALERYSLYVQEEMKDLI